jgi:hypothetical protein
MSTQSTTHRSRSPTRRGKTAGVGLVQGRHSRPHLWRTCTAGRTVPGRRRGAGARARVRQHAGAGARRLLRRGRGERGRAWSSRTSASATRASPAARARCSASARSRSGGKTVLCSGRGKCISDRQQHDEEIMCSCDEGFAGDACEFKCPGWDVANPPGQKECNGKGQCQLNPARTAAICKCSANSAGVRPGVRVQHRTSCLIRGCSRARVSTRCARTACAIVRASRSIMRRRQLPACAERGDSHASRRRWWRRRLATECVLIKRTMNTKNLLKSRNEQQERSNSRHFHRLSKNVFLATGRVGAGRSVATRG